jgi:hypothetical protein
MLRFAPRAEFEGDLKFQSYLFIQILEFEIRAGLTDEDLSIISSKLYYNIVKYILEKIGVSVENVQDHVEISISYNYNKIYRYVIKNKHDLFIQIDDDIFDIPNVIMTLIYEVLISLEGSKELLIDENILYEYNIEELKTVFNISFFRDILPKFGNEDMDCSSYNPDLGIPYALTCSHFDDFKYPAVYTLFYESILKNLNQTQLQVLYYGPGDDSKVAEDIKSMTARYVVQFDMKIANFLETKNFDEKIDVVVIWPLSPVCVNDNCSGCIGCEHGLTKYEGVTKLWNDFIEIIRSQDVNIIHIIMPSKSSECKNFCQLVDEEQTDINGKQYTREHISSRVYFPLCGQDPKIFTYYILTRKNLSDL